MAHYAKVLNGIVQTVIVAEPEFFDDFVDDSPGDWIQTSYNTYGDVHYARTETGALGEPDGGVALRKNYAHVGGGYDAENDAFYAARPSLYGVPFDSWTLNQTTFLWEPPIPYPDDADSVHYTWNEESQIWEQMSEAE